MGSPAIALPSLEAVQRGADLCLVVTQPDRPAGRGRKLTPPPIKQRAQSLGLPLVQPAKMRDGTLARQLESLRLDLVVVVAFGRILPPEVLRIPRFGCINLHFSQLPQWRGAAPVQRAILAGHSSTGISIMAMDEGLDTGAVYRQVAVPIDPLETAGELGDRLALVGAEALGDFLQAFPDVSAPTAQDSASATLAPPLRKDEGRIDWSQPMQRILDQVRGLDPWPVAFTERRGVPLKLFAARPGPVADRTAPAGEVLGVNGDGMHVACADGVLLVHDVQPAGRKRMEARAYASGAPFAPGERLG